MGRHDPHQRRRFHVAAAAFVWSLALIPAAFYLPVYHGERSNSTGASIPTSATLVQANGTWVLIPMAVPALLALIVWVALTRRERSRVAALTATGTVLVLGAFNLLAILSIGIFIVPATVLLACAVWAGPAGAPARAQRPPAAA